MSDTLEERLASRLRALVDTIDDELPPPADLELQVLRHRRHTRARRRWSGVSVAAAIIAVATTAAVIHGTSDGRGRLQISTTPSTAAPAPDALPPGTMMLSSSGRFVTSLNAEGHTNATLVTAASKSAVIRYARATADHSEVWYLSLKGAKKCGDVVREDVAAGTTRIVTHAVAFDVSPDGTRLALFGGGDVVGNHCTPVKQISDGKSDGKVVVRDVTTGEASEVAMTNVTSLRWSPDGSYLVAVRCSDLSCAEGFDRIDVPGELGAPLRVEQAAETYSNRTVDSATVEFGPDGLYALERTTALGVPNAKPADVVARVNPITRFAVEPVFSGGNEWRISQLVPTAKGTYVVASKVPPVGAKSKVVPHMYLIRAGKLVKVRDLPPAPGTFTAVTPLATAG